MEANPKVTCEVCGQGEIVDTDSSRHIYMAIDLWVCDHCAYVFSFIMGHVREASQKAKVQGDQDVLERAIIQMERNGKMYPLNAPLPRILSDIIERRDRIDSLIVDDD